METMYDTIFLRFSKPQLRTSFGKHHSKVVLHQLYYNSITQLANDNQQSKNFQVFLFIKLSKAIILLYLQLISIKMFIKAQKEVAQETLSPKLLPPFDREKFLKQFENLRESQEENMTFKKSSHKKKTKLRFQYWDSREVQRVFTLYNQYGSMWKLISSEFVDRAPNSIKNRFYTALRNLLKILFRCHPSIKKIPHEIISKDLLRFYHARDEFSNFKGFAFHLLKKMNFSCQKSDAKNLCQTHLQEIKQIYDILFNSEKDEVSLVKNIKKDLSSENISKEEVEEQPMNVVEETPFKENQNIQMLNPVNFPLIPQYSGMPMMIPQMFPMQNMNQVWNSGMLPFTYYI